MSTNHTLGIGMGIYEFGITILVDPPAPGNVRRENQVSRPSTFINFADAGAVTTDTAGDPNADNWVPDIPYDATTMQYFGGGVSYFRVPSAIGYGMGDSRSLPRHNKRCNFGFIDGHAEALKNSKAGYNVYKPTGEVTPQPEAAWWALRH